MALGQDPELVLFDRSFDRRTFLSPVGDEFVDADRVNHRARKNMGTDLGSLFDDAYGGLVASLCRELLQADGGRKTCGPPPTITTS